MPFYEMAIIDTCANYRNLRVFLWPKTQSNNVVYKIKSFKSRALSGRSKFTIRLGFSQHTKTRLKDDRFDRKPQWAVVTKSAHFLASFVRRPTNLIPK